MCVEQKTMKIIIVVECSTFVFEEFTFNIEKVGKFIRQVNG